MATSESDEVEALLSMATEVVPGPSATLQLAGLANMEGNIVTEVSMSELKPIVMTMANMANMVNMTNVVEDQNIVPAANVPEPENDIQISDQSETVLASHLLSSLPARHRLHPQVRQQSTEVYRDSMTGVTYEIQRGATRRGGDKLIDSLGFTYNLKVGKSKNKNISYWWCAVRNQQLRCPASVTQKGNTFVRGKNKHEHLVGQCTPKNAVKNPVKNPVLKMGRPAGSIKMKPFSEASKNSKDFKIIRNGSKAGMDLLKDSLGYTYTLKKVMGGGLKTYWCCSVRNRHLRCPASVIQYGENHFTGGKYGHKHLPHQNIPAGPYDVIPSLKDFKNHQGQVSDESDIEDGEDDFKDRSYTRKKASNGSVYIHSGKVVTTTSSRVRLSLSREKKRRDHPTFLGPRCTINLTKCDDPECNCRQVHCPFCDKHHFKPTKAGRVQDHLELTHFAHGVQYDDLMIVKCFQDCDLEKTFGHYHCVFCFRQMLKRTAYARHMLRHMTKMGIPDRLLVLPDSKFPDIINAYGYEIPICKNTSCGPPSQEKHYHCPNCSQMCRERSLTVNHLWRCLQKKRDGVADPSNETEEDIMGVVDDDQLMLHFSHVKAFKDIPVEKCVSIDCCHQKYHCKFCPKNVFLPTYRQHLIAHYVSHWKQRVLYKNLSILKCFNPCDGIDRSMCKTRYHYHCPICAKIILTKGTFEEHLKSCHMFRFGENLIQNIRVAQEETIENDIIMTQESAPLNENVEFMEDQLTSEAAMRHERRRLSREMFKSRKQKAAKKAKNKKPKKKKYVEPSSSSEYYSEEEEEEEEAEEEEKIVENDVYELCSAVISPKIAKKVRSTSQLKTLLGGVAGATRVKLSLSKSGQYRLTGPAEELLTAQRMLTKKINKNMTDDDEDSSPKRKEKGKGSVKRKGQAVSPKKSEEKRGRGRPRKDNVYNDDSFPYSEIKQIIEASKDSKSKTSNRGRGRPAKKVEQKPDGTPKETVTVRVVENPSKHGLSTARSVGLKGRSVQVEYTESVQSTPRTPGRYGTRGVRKDYVELSSGGVRIKQEPLSDGEDNFEQEVYSRSFSSSRNRGSSKKMVDEFDEPKKTGKTKAGRGRGRPRKSIKTEDEVDNDMDEVGTSAEEDADKRNEVDDVDQDIDDIKQEDDGDMEIEPEEEDMDDSLSLYDDSDEEFPAADDEENEDSELQDTNADHNYITIAGKSKDEADNDGENPDSEYRNDENGDVKGTQVPPVHKIGMGKSNLPKTDITRTEKTKETSNLDNKCSLCDDYMAESFSDLTEHLKTVHHVYDPPRCDICEMDFDTTQTLKSHIERKHGPEKQKYSCDFTDCSREFVSESGKYGHMNRVHLNIETRKDKKYTCDKCEYKTNSMEDMCEHNKVIHNAPIKCEVCDKIFMTFQSLKSHSQLTHSGQSVNCNICNKAFSHESYLTKHMKSHYSSDFACPICNKRIKSKASLKSHMDTHVDPSERSYKYICSYCGKQFALKSNLNDHINKHTGDKPYKCDLCEKCFGFRSMLMKHKTFVHSSERPYKCDICHKGFKFMNLLKNHLTTHTNTSKHVCSQCNKTFSTASTLKFHARKCRGVSWKQNLILPHPPGTLFVFTEPGPSTNQAVEVQQDTEIQYATPTGIQYAPPPQENQQIVHFPDFGEIETTGITGEIEVVNDESGTINNVVMEEETVSEPVPAETEVYACSECQATFNTYKDAETHVLTAHSVIPTPDEGIDLETENIVLG